MEASCDESSPETNPAKESNQSIKNNPRHANEENDSKASENGFEIGVNPTTIENQEMQNDAMHEPLSNLQ